MNYYIQGDAAKAEQIRAAFESKGYDVSWPEGCANPDVINIGVERNGAKYVVAETSEYIKDIIKTHPDYKELELPVEPKFKVGDWIAYNENESSITPMQIIKITEDKYIVSGHWFYDFRTLEADWHLWTIEDAKDGDVLATDNIICIFRKLDKDGYYIISPCIYTVKDGLEIISDENDTIGSCGFKPATKEDRELLFRKMKEVGYEWDADKKKLKNIPKHYDIANFKPFDKVLVRDRDIYKWKADFFSRYAAECMFSCVGSLYKQCIPYNDDTKHLLGTTDMCGEEYINW